MSKTEKKKLGFADKIKKMLESDSPKEKDKPIIGEKNIKFTLTGSSIHSELLVAEATLNQKKAQYQNENLQRNILKKKKMITIINNSNNSLPLPVVCKWYNKTKTDQITEIEGITGAFYQPNADDINTYIIVEAIPILEDCEYQGEPLKKEIGPLVLDKQIEEEVQELLETGRFKIAAKLESICNPSLSDEDNEKRSEHYQLPKQCSVQIDSERVSICVQDDSRINATCSLGQFYPSIKIIKKTNNVLELYFNQNQMFRLQTESNTHRDVITVALRMFCGKKLFTSEHSNDYQSEQDYTNDYNQDQDKENNNNSANCQLSEEDYRENSKIGDFYRNSANDLMNKKLNAQINQQQVRIQKRHSTFDTSESYEVFVKLNELTKKSVDLEQIRDDLKSQIKELQSDNSKQESKNKELELQFSDIKNKLKEQLEINEQYKQKHSQYMNEKLFLTQIHELIELNNFKITFQIDQVFDFIETFFKLKKLIQSELQVIQNEIEGKNREIEEYKQLNLNLKKQLDKKKEVIDEEEAQSLQKTIQDLADKLNNQIQQNKLIEQQLNDQETKFNEVNSLKESLQNEVLHFKKKYECILQERQMLITSQKSLDSPKLNIVQNVSSSNSSTGISKREGDDSGSEKADSENLNSLSGHSHLSQPINNTNLQNQIQGISSLFTVNKNGCQPTSVNHINQVNNQNVNNLNQDKKMQINIKQIEQPHSNISDIEIIKNELLQKIEENHNLLIKLQSLQVKFDSLTSSYAQDLKSLNLFSKKNTKENGNEQMLQKLVQYYYFI